MMNSYACHSERSEESLGDLRARSFASLRMTWARPIMLLWTSAFSRGDFPMRPGLIALVIAAAGIGLGWETASRTQAADAPVAVSPAPGNAPNAKPAAKPATKPATKPAAAPETQSRTGGAAGPNPPHAGPLLPRADQYGRQHARRGPAVLPGFRLRYGDSLRRFRGYGDERDRVPMLGLSVRKLSTAVARSETDHGADRLWIPGAAVWAPGHVGPVRRARRL